MSEIIGDMEGVVGLIDDLERRRRNMIHVSERFSQDWVKRVTLSKEKCKFRIQFLGQLVDEAGVRSDPEKVRVIQNMKPPANISELRRFDKIS